MEGSLTLEKLPALETFICDGRNNLFESHQLSSLDVSKNTALIDLWYDDTVTVIGWEDESGNNVQVAKQGKVQLSKRR